MFFFYLSSVFGGAWHADEHVLAEVEGAVIPAAESDGLDGEVFPLGELGGDEVLDEGDGNI